MNERTIELHDIAPKEFWGTQDAHLETIKKYYPKLKIVARGTTLKAFGEKAELDEFEKRFNRLMVHFTRYNTIDTNVIDRVILSDSREEQRMADIDKILVHGIGGKLIKAMTPNQQLLVDCVNKNDMVFAVGPAGTGKTYTGVAMAVKALKEKLDPYMQPLYDALRDMLPPQTLDDYILKGIIQIAPLAFMRGRTLDNAFVILDEAQNTTHSQMKMFLTRMGKNAKFMITGDPGQVDLPRRTISGLKEAILVLKDVEGISIIYLDDKDIVRHRLVKKVIDAYKQIENND